MPKEKMAYEVGVGEEFEPLELRVTPEFNEQILEAVEDYHPRYRQETSLGPPIVHPALLIGQSNITRSPSHRLPPGKATVHTKEEVEFINPGRVGKSFRVTWKVVDVYQKRGRPFQVKEALITDEDGLEILRRRITDTFMDGEG
jgi:hypothetical protein